MLLRELFDPRSAYQLEWRHNQARFLTADNREIRVSFHDQNLSTTSLVEITFSARVNDPTHGKSGTMGITGKGDAPRIFGTVLQAISDYLSQNHPEYIMFTADEPSRQKLYSHMVRRLAQQYHSVSEREFQLINNDELPAPTSNIFLLKSNRSLNEGLYVDVPNDEWLAHKIDAVRGRTDHQGVPRMYTVTAYTSEPVEVPMHILKRLPGMRGEQSNVRHSDLGAIMHIMKTTGRLPQHNGQDYVPFINVAHDGSAWVNEGNHRIMAAAALGWDSLPVDIRYFEGGERQPGPMNPGKLGL